jgi:hypothetical protein
MFPLFQSLTRDKDSCDSVGSDAALFAEPVSIAHSR